MSAAIGASSLHLREADHEVFKKDVGLSGVDFLEKVRNVLTQLDPSISYHLHKTEGRWHLTVETTLKFGRVKQAIASISINMWTLEPRLVGRDIQMVFKSQPFKSEIEPESQFEMLNLDAACFKAARLEILENFANSSNQ